ncbi:WD40-repeat-containing domain protein, partial [Piptocephalis cylindrospora]
MLLTEAKDVASLHGTLQTTGLIGPITGLEFVEAPKGHQGRLLLVLVGSRLRVHRVGLQDEGGVPGMECRLGQGFRGHGMTLDRINPGATDKEHIHILVWGGKRAVQDWILDAHLLRLYPQDTHPRFLASIDTHNQLLVRSYPELTILARYQCSERCLLYCARLRGGRTLEEGLIVASGTVFQGVLLWSVSLQEAPIPELTEVEVDQRFTDHEGVIFSVRFSSSGDQVISVSDDRSIRIWPRQMVNSAKRHPTVLYGHQARIWDAILLNQEGEDLVVSVGEDATCRVWDLAEDTTGQSGRAIACWEGHAVKHIWSLAISKSGGLVATGGGDHGVKLWSLDGVLQGRRGQGEVESQALHTWPFPQVDEYLQEDFGPSKDLWSSEAFRNFVLLDPISLAIVTSAGLLHYSSHLAGYASMTSSEDGRLIVCGGLEGHLILILPESLDQIITLHPHKAKVSDVFVQEADGPDGGWVVFS